MSQYAADSLEPQREITPEINGTTRSQTSSPQATIRLTAATNGVSRPTPPPYTGTMRTYVKNLFLPILSGLGHKKAVEVCTGRISHKLRLALPEKTSK